MTPKPTSPRTVNQSWLKQLTASFDDLVGAGKEGATDRDRSAATYAVSEIPRLRAAPIMPASDHHQRTDEALREGDRVAGNAAASAKKGAGADDARTLR